MYIYFCMTSHAHIHSSCARVSALTQYTDVSFRVLAVVGGPAVVVTEVHLDARLFGVPRRIEALVPGGVSHH